MKNPVLNAKLNKYPFGQIYQFFGENVELYKKALNSNGHNGVDIVSYQGCPILATKGIVVEVKDTPTGYGKHIRILTNPDQNGNLFELVYGHCDWLLVKSGNKVEDEQQIAGMSNTGYVISAKSGKTIPYWGNAPVGYGVHLHFGVRPASLSKTMEKEGEKFYPAFGKTIYFPYYENGMFGYVDPLKHIKVDAKLASYFWGLLEVMKMKALEIKNKGR